MGQKQDKTNVMRILEQQKIPYRHYLYDASLLIATEVASALGKDPAMLFKTLVTVGKSKEHYVFMVPSAKELDLKKAAQAADEKALEMIPQKELLPLTGYIHGGCSSIGMKKPFPTFIDTSATTFESICFSAGRIGIQVETSFWALQKAIAITVADITR